MPWEGLVPSSLRTTPASEVGEIMVSCGSQIFAAGALALTQRPMLPLAFALISVLALEATAIAVQRAPEGYEDETGFHFTKRAVNGKGS